MRRRGAAVKALRWVRLVRVGVSPLSLSRRLLLGDYGLRFQGVEVSAANLPVAWDVALPIWSGEYDEPGFVPGHGDIVVDIGANIGAFAMLAASRGARVRSYEPHPDSFAHMERNTAKWRVECHRAAVTTEHADTVQLYLGPRDTRNTLLGKDAKSARELDEQVEVPAIPLAEVLRDPVDLLKLDVEGGEFDLLWAEPHLLRRAKRIIAEVHTVFGDEDALLAHVQAAGFDARLKRPISEDADPYVQLTAVRT
jgi:FkbM family methyltransferase